MNHHEEHRGRFCSRRWLLAGMLFCLVGLSVLAAGRPAGAVEPDEVLADAQLEQRARALSSELRCLVCQNQSIDDSNAPLAKDLRVIVRDRLRAGDSDADIRRYVVARYGDFVLLRPPFAWNTLLLWLAPLLLLVATGAAIWRTRLAPAVRLPPLTAAEEARLADLVREIPRDKA